MKIEQFLWKTVVKTGREADLLLQQQLVRIVSPSKTTDGPGWDRLAEFNEVVKPTDTVMVFDKKIGWQTINHPSE